MPSASKGETWPKRLPRPGPFGSKVSKLWNSTIRPISGATRTAKASRARPAARQGAGPGSGGAVPRQADPHPDRRRDRQPDRARVAVGVGGADRDQRRGHESQRRVAPGGIAARLPQGEDEGEDEEGLHRLLEGALGEVGGDHVGEADEEGAGDPVRPGQRGEGRQRGERGDDRDSDGEPVESLDEADPRSPVQGDDDRVRPERIALAQQLGALAAGEPVGGQQVLGHVRVEAGAEDPEMAFGDEGERGREQGEEADREAGPEVPPLPFEPCPAGRGPRRP